MYSKKGACINTQVIKLVNWSELAAPDTYTCFLHPAILRSHWRSTILQIIIIPETQSGSREPRGAPLAIQSHVIPFVDPDNPTSDMAEAASPVLNFLFFQNSITTFVFARRFYNLFSHHATERERERKRERHPWLFGFTENNIQKKNIFYTSRCILLQGVLIIYVALSYFFLYPK